MGKMAPAAAVPSGGKGWKNIRNGAVLQCVEAVTLGMPLEVWKTRMGRFRHESTTGSFRAILEQVFARLHPLHGATSHAHS